ncbi:MAG: cytochrome b/b6 domain-containing protein [Novosphingobium sp.]
MRAPDTARYSRTAMALHWAGALAVAANLAAGYWMEGRPRGPEKMDAFQLHMSLGMMVLLLSLVRAGWRLVSPPPPLPASVSPAQRSLLHAVHAGFYALLVLLPMSGWVIASASPLDLPKHWFGLFPWPDLPLETSRPTARAAAGAHGLLVKALWALLALHLAGALRHIVTRDGLAARMIPFLSRQGR